MPKLKDKTFVTFNSGVCEFCQVENRTIVRTKITGVRYGDRVTGIRKYMDAKVLSSQIDRTIAIPLVPGISQQDVCIIDEKQYRIELLQDKYDANPPHYVLSLQNIVPLYKDVRCDGKEKWD